ncbi:MAG TPA: hypothetical protein VKE42_07770, partial [Candidatus Cybelea sp.]|nr:hypothetical protein [Candidatus Cybelea sp.]
KEALIDAALQMTIRRDMTEAEAQACKANLDRANDVLAEMASIIRGQIDECEASMARGGKVDPDWWRRVNVASRRKGWQRQQLQGKIGDVNRLLRAFRRDAEPSKTRDWMFLQIAKLHLPKETFQRLQRLTDEAEKAHKE